MNARTFSVSVARLALSAAMSLGLATGASARMPTPEERWAALIAGASLAVAADASADAKGFARQAVRVAERHFGRGDRRTADSLRLLGYLHLAAQEYPQALHYLHRALAAMDASERARDPWVVTVLKGLIDVAIASRQPTEAEALSQQAVAIREQAFGPLHPSVAEALAWMAKAQLARGHTQEARRSVARIRTILAGPQANAPEAAPAFELLGELESEQQEWPRALSYYQHAVALRERAKTIDSPTTASTFRALARVFRSMERRGEARAAERHVQAMATRGQDAYRTWRSDHHEVSVEDAGDTDDTEYAQLTNAAGGHTRDESLEAAARSLTERAALYAKFRETAEATRLFQQALDVYQRLHGDDWEAIAARLLRHRDELLEAGRDQEAQFVTQRLALITRVAPAAASAGDAGATGAP